MSETGPPGGHFPSFTYHHAIRSRSGRHGSFLRVQGSCIIVPSSAIWSYPCLQGIVSVDPLVFSLYYIYIGRAGTHRDVPDVRYNHFMWDSAGPGNHLEKVRRPQIFRRSRRNARNSPEIVTKCTKMLILQSRKEAKHGSNRNYYIHAKYTGILRVLRTNT